MKSINLLFTKSQNDVIGRENEMLWYLQRESSDFNDKTKNHIVLMGKRTWETLPTISKPFKDRLNIVVTRDKTFTHYEDNVNVIYDLEWYLQEYKKLDTDKMLWVIGGGDILQQSMKYADKIIVIEIGETIKGEIKAPKIDKRSFKLDYSSDLKIDNLHNKEYYTSIYSRISKSWLIQN